MKNKNKNLENIIIYNDYYDRLKNIGLSVFKWEGLPPSINERFLEETLFNTGNICFFYEENMDEYLVLPCNLTGSMDVYGEPTRYEVQSCNGYHKSLTNKEGVIIYNNSLKIPTTTTISLFAKRLYECDTTATTNVITQKIPWFIKCPETQRLTMVNLFDKVRSNEPLIYGYNDIDMDGITKIDLKVEYTADRLLALQHEIWDDALTFLGIENSNQDKKERLVVDEVGSNYGNVEIERNIKLNTRREACDKINEMYGLNVSVKFRSDLKTNVNSQNIDDEVEVDYV